MENNGFVSYLNSLHNYNAQNENAYGEKNISSPFYEKVSVRIGIGDYITNILKTGEPQIIILTGHAGDGKTSIMYQVTKDFEFKLSMDQKYVDLQLPSKKTCRFIKDFSELTDNEKLDLMKESFQFPQQGNFVFMVANTGPLINTYRKLFPSKTDRDEAEIKLIEAMDKNPGKVSADLPFKINVINVAEIDNTYFAEKLLTNFLKDELWAPCEECSKKSHCFILRNIQLIKLCKNKSFSFISKHYIWLFEHGVRLTIRSMTEQLAFMITGGFYCGEVKNFEPHKYLFSNLFFGFVGNNENSKAEGILSIKATKVHPYYLKRMRVDEDLMISKKYSSLFPVSICGIVEQAEEKGISSQNGWKEFLHRLYFFTNITTNEQRNLEDSTDIFSSEFDKYLNWRSGTKKVCFHDLDFILEALSMIYMGAANKNNDILLTLSRKNGALQNVQLIVGELSKRKFSAKFVTNNSETLNPESKRNSLIMTYDGNDLECTLSLPLLDYFDDLRKGIVSTTIDPQLSHGVESLKAQLSIIESRQADDGALLKLVILRKKENRIHEIDLSNANEIKVSA